ncbi:sensor histidine kinase [Yinghuangia seranimata]|uniref:sensor histidine kinase n=1 Tax=Yinghuangia seranimata TaxID=408067 RepID=UPI00248BEA10|nr:histidine kinase [Yinghuangia seranimata]MDI2131129.1 histidine kinase [Yinghuangia seranimata]
MAESMPSPLRDTAMRFGRLSRAVRPIRPWHWQFADGLVAAVFALLSWGVLVHDTPHRAAAAAGALLAALPLALCRRRPMAAAGCALAAYGLAPASAQIVFLALPGAVWALYAVAGRTPLRVGVPALGAACVAAGATGLPRFEHNGAIAPVAFAFTAAWVAGYANGQRRRAAAEAARREVDQARREAAEERLRIARELHDVVAHGMSVITVQAGYGNLVVGTQPDQAAAALDAIEHAGRETLDELRRMLGVLRTHPQSDALSLQPAPGLGDLPRLLERIAQAGVAVSLTELDDGGVPCAASRELAPGLGLCVYRVIQESLTNVVRHAGTDAAMVALRHGTAALDVQITDEGCGAEARVRPGRGLTGMRERVELYGGALDFGPVGTGGFRVRATFPYPA